VEVAPVAASKKGTKKAIKKGTEEETEADLNKRMKNIKYFYRP